MPHNELLAAAAEVDITPPIGHRMAGHFYEVQSEDVHDPLKAKVLVFQQGEEKLALAFCDVVSLAEDTTREARETFSAIGQMPVANSAVFATHSHTGPLFSTIQRDFFHGRAVSKYGTDPNEAVHYPDFLVDRLAEAFETANSQLAPAQLSTMLTQQRGLSFNRRYHMRDGTVRFNPGQLNPDIVKPAGPIDPEIAHLAVTDSGTERAIGGLTVFACHTDTLGGTLYSADYPYFIQQALQRQYGPDFVSAFALGTCGDINHINVDSNGPRKGVKVTGRIGTTIGNAVLAGQNTSSSIEAPALKTASATFDMPLRVATSAQIADAKASLALLGEPNADAHFKEVVDAITTLDIAQKGENWPVEVQAFQFDANTAFVGLPGEIFAELGLRIKRESPFPNTLVASLANQGFSYIPTQKAFYEGSYEVEHSLIKPGGGELLTDTAIGLLQELKG